MRIQTDQFTCGACGHVFSAEMVMSAPISLWIASTKAIRCPECDADYKQIKWGAAPETEQLRADLKEERERVAALEAVMNPQDVADVDAALSATASNAPSVDGVAGDVQPLRPRE